MKRPSSLPFCYWKSSMTTMTGLLWLIFKVFERIYHITLTYYFFYSFPSFPPISILQFVFNTKTTVICNSTSKAHQKIWHHNANMNFSSAKAENNDSILQMLKFKKNFGYDQHKYNKLLLGHLWWIALWSKC